MGGCAIFSCFFFIYNFNAMTFFKELFVLTYWFFMLVFFSDCCCHTKSSYEVFTNATFT